MRKGALALTSWRQIGLVLSYQHENNLHQLAKPCWTLLDWGRAATYEGGGIKDAMKHPRSARA
jgi:hypothetical protein